MLLVAEFSQYFFGFSIFVTSLFLVMLVLVQRGRGGGLTGALGGAGGQSAFGTKAGDLFTRITVGVAALWIFLCAAAVFFLKDRGLPQTGVDNRPKATLNATDPAGGMGATPPAATTPATTTPASPSSNGASGGAATPPAATTPVETAPATPPAEGASADDTAPAATAEGALDLTPPADAPASPAE